MRCEGDCLNCSSFSLRQFQDWVGCDKLDGSRFWRTPFYHSDVKFVTRLEYSIFSTVQVQHDEENNCPDETFGLSIAAVLLIFSRHFECQQNFFSRFVQFCIRHFECQLSHFQNLGTVLHPTFWMSISHLQILESLRKILHPTLWLSIESLSN